MTANFCYIIKGSEKSDFCKVIFKSHTSDFGPGFGVDLFVSLFVKKKKEGNLDNINAILSERKIKKEMTMMEIENRATRYSLNIVSETNKEGDGGGGGVADGFDDVQPWISNRAHDKNYRKQRVKNRVMSQDRQVIDSSSNSSDRDRDK